MLPLLKYWPAGHSNLHLFGTGVADIQPPGQLVQPIAPYVWYFPLTQLVHAFKIWFEEPGVYRPAGQFLQVEDCKNLPTTHDKHFS